MAEARQGTDVRVSLTSASDFSPGLADFSTWCSTRQSRVPVVCACVPRVRVYVWLHETWGAGGWRRE